MNKNQNRGLSPISLRWIFLMNKNENRGLPPVCLVYLRPVGKALINTNIYLRNKKWLF